MRQRILREIKRTGPFRFVDVLTFRLYYRLVHSRRDRAWERRRLAELCETYSAPSAPVPILRTGSPNSGEAIEFIREVAPDIVIARCKTLLKESVFSIPRLGTFVMHPGICPEYRNAHGCFWAFANGDYGRVGMTLLQVDRGVDTGAIYGYYTCAFDEQRESHIVIQHRTVFDNLDALRRKLEEIHAGHAETIDTAGRNSSAWGQPWLSRYLQWKWSAWRRRSVESRRSFGFHRAVATGMEQRELRFEFGKNWSAFLPVLNEERIGIAETSLKAALGVENLHGKSFLDVGCGSGLFSLAAVRLGATVHSFDYDPQSVAAAAELKRRYCPNAEHWSIEQGSVLDRTYLWRLGQFDIVYSWGVLHHTGDMWRALENVLPLLREPNGTALHRHL
jgi:2-polyprenyl-3-methyl-5-hydroxy-6-metoxy-1,4-benzoquinol methylase